MLLMAAVSSLAGCLRPTESAGATASIDQDELCEVKDWQLDTTAQACKPGQKVVFLPSSWGNEQLPILFTAVNCDLRYAVVSTNGGVVCVFKPIVPVEVEAKPENK